MSTSRLNVIPAALCALFIFVVCAPTATAGETLNDILLEKGIITKDDWRRIRNAEQRREATAEPQTIEDKRAAEELILNIVTTREADAARRTVEEQSPVTVGWDKRGFSLATGDGLFSTTLQWRVQGRWTYPGRSDPLDQTAFDDHAESSFELRRIRMKIGGHGYQPWIHYYFEIDLQPGRSFDGASDANVRLLDWRISLARYPWATLMLGQWKINYNRERVDSSGKQTFVERSIVNRVFTLDRQIGVMLHGRLNPGTPADMHYYAGIWSGGGRGLEGNDDDNMMYMGRLQWNVFGRELQWRQSDTTFHARPAASLSMAGYTTIGKCTRWSSNGCGELRGFIEDGQARDGQFRVEGVQVGTAFKYRGFAWQHENHWKRVKDGGRDADAMLMPAEDVRASQAELFGGYFQAGYFLHYLMPVIPKPLETALRYAYVDSEVAGFDDFRQEWTGALNWFFAGHRNKVTLDASFLTLNRSATERRVRLQWDVSF